MFYGSPTGGRVWALDREAMHDGQPMAWVAFDLGSAYWSLLPSNLRGDPPPAGSPNYSASIEYPNTLRLWEFHVDWDTPSYSTFTGPTNVGVAFFNQITDIPQPAPGEWLDSLGDRLTMRLQYRNFGSHESLWVNHTIRSGGVAGVRWYELRDPGGAPSIFQQGTYRLADGNYRWMGSLAVDKAGNLAVGYSVSSTSQKPAIRYAGRLVDDPLGVLPQAEASIIEGNGVQVSGAGRWGDYTAMTVDPVDDCTFWYTNEYYEVDSNRNWQTRIGSFRFPSCGEEPKMFVHFVWLDDIKPQLGLRSTDAVSVELVLGLVRIIDETNAPVAGATVDMEWTLPVGGGYVYPTTRRTRAGGLAVPLTLQRWGARTTCG